MLSLFSVQKFKIMIKANELKVGNYVHRIFDSPKSNKDFEVIKIAGINAIENTYVCSDDSIGGLQELAFIDLNSEILKRLKIESSDLNDYKENVVYELHNKFYYVIDTYYDSCDATCYTEIEVKYVHELQNLYFALTSKELVLSEA
ncbi:hypothetical protein [Tenacibaculum finnmarkense]|uniref:hypothetical protein n=2 Tax=Tenacibaculum finnmarkense TaxID=2781243 RepID=UPI001EFA9DBE|nr:hypothetical protein [Tenacibaculum finnmarkense]